MGNNLHNYLKSFFHEYKFYLICLFIVAIIAGLFNIAIDYKVKEIIDTIQLSPNQNILKLISLFIIYKLIRHGMFFIYRILELKYHPQIATKVMSDMYKKTLIHSMHWFDSRLSGDISNKIIDFRDNFLDVIHASFFALADFAIFIFALVFLLKVNFLSAMVFLGFFIIYIPVIGLLLKKQTKLQKEYINAKQETVGIINDSIANIFSVKIIGNLMNEFKLKLNPALEKTAETDRAIRKFNTYFVDFIDTIIVTLISGVQIFLLVYLFQNGKITAGEFVFIIMVTLQIHRNLERLIESLLFTINPAIASIKASYAFINSNYDTLDKPNAIILNKIHGDLKYENVSFAYNNERDILQNFNLHIFAGQKIGIVGTSGAGKTTFIKCLLRYFDMQRGRILIDDIDIKDVTQESLRANISIIPQDISMFHRTILENLQIAKYDANFEEIVIACKKAKIHDDIMQMPHGYNSIVGERGVKISGGQRQRIAIARAILKNSPILLLDEATSALDTPTEKLIQTSLEEMLETQNATTIVIAHRLSTLLHMDRILVFDNGMIVEDGTHQELLTLNKKYKELWDAQVNGFLLDMKSDNI